MKKKLSLACALIHRPEVLFLDEPFEGVDAVASRMLKELMQRLTARGMTIFLTSHVLEIVERLCSEIAIINRGRLIASGPLDRLRRGIAAQGETLSLEDYFLRVLGAEHPAEKDDRAALDWL